MRTLDIELQYDYIDEQALIYFFKKSLDGECNKYIEKVKISFKRIPACSKDLHAFFSRSEIKEHPKYLLSNTEMIKHIHNYYNLEARFRYRSNENRELVIDIERVPDPGV